MEQDNDRDDLDLSKVDWETILVYFGVDQKKLDGKKRHECPVCHAKDQFRFTNSDGKGHWFCKCAPGRGAGSGFALVQALNPGMSNAKIFEEIRIALSLPAVTTTVCRQDDSFSPENVEKNRKKIAWMLKIARPIKGTPAERYLKNRVPDICIETLGNSILYVPNIEYWHGEGEERKSYGKFPVMIARVVDTSGKLVTLHRTFITRDGFKADLPKAKKQMPGLKKLEGEAVIINQAPESRILHIAEGIETAAAVARAHRYKFTTWSMLNAGNIAAAVIPWDRFDEVVVFGDRDSPIRDGKGTGQMRAETLLERVRGSNKKGSLRLPPSVDEDFADLWVKSWQQKAEQGRVLPHARAGATGGANGHLRMPPLKQQQQLRG